MVKDVNLRVCYYALFFGLAIAAFTAVTGFAGAQGQEPVKPSLTPENAEEVLPPGYVKSGPDYIYENGAVVVTPAAATQSTSACPDRWLCLWRDSSFNGSRWRFRQHHWQDLNTYGASDEVSSWKNEKHHKAKLGWDSIAQGISPVLGLPTGASASHMGSWNDQASSVKP